MKHTFVWSNNIEGNNLCFYCANWKRKKFFCTDPTDVEPVVLCKYYLPLGASEAEADLLMLELLEGLIEE